MLLVVVLFPVRDSDSDFVVFWRYASEFITLFEVHLKLIIIYGVFEQFQFALIVAVYCIIRFIYYNYYPLFKANSIKGDVSLASST